MERPDGQGELTRFEAARLAGFAKVHGRSTVGVSSLRFVHFAGAATVHSFFSQFSDLESWMNTMHALVASNEVAKDVTGAEALLERHQVTCLEM